MTAQVTMITKFKQMRHFTKKSLFTQRRAILDLLWYFYLQITVVNIGD